MNFVVDTVGEITNPQGDTFRGVILAVPLDASEAEARDMMRRASRMFAGRVKLTEAD